MRPTPPMPAEVFSPVTANSLSRRRLLQASGAGALVLALPSAAFATDAPAGPVPDELRRASYLGQIGQAFAVSGGPTLTLARVDDVSGAAGDRSLAGRDDAFVLTFEGAAGATLDSSAHELTHPVLGPVTLFISPVDRESKAPRFEVVVDRSIPLAAAFRAAPAASAEAAEAAASATDPATVSAAAASGLTAASLPAVAHAALQRVRVTAKARRVGNHVVAALKFPGGGIQAVEVQLMRRGRLYATGTGAVKHGKVEVSLKPGRTVPRGTYDLIITATTARSAVKSVARIVKLR